MELVNQTPIVAEATISKIDGSDLRIGLLTAKATFRWNERGTVELEKQEPVPLLKEDLPTPHGAYPSDLVLRRSTKLEVCILGCAYAANGRAVEAMNVSARVGREKRNMFVFGDRIWEGRGKSAVPSKPMPFTRMPLTWDRAYGGSAQIYMDKTNALPAAHYWNPHGKGFNSDPAVDGYGKGLGALPGFPIAIPKERALPNLENPATPIRAWADEPEPWCWSTIPLEVPYRHFQLVQRATARKPETKEKDFFEHDPLVALAPGREIEWDEAWFRAHNTWIIDVANGPIEIEISGMSSDHKPIRISVPDLELAADYVIGTKTGSLPLVRQNLVIDTENRCMTLTARASFRAPDPSETERSFRLRANVIEAR